MTLADKLTVSRVVLTFVFMLFLFSNGVEAKILALFIFLLASLTDFLDGYIARSQGLSTDFGKLMDPIADKVLTLAAFLAFVEMKIIPAWMVLIIIFREVAITGLRLSALSKGKVIISDGYGKHKMVSQVISIFAILLFLVFRDGGSKIFGFWSLRMEYIYKDAIFILMLVTIALTLISGLACLVKNRGVYTNAKAN